ncbi:unnamed protein product, partial [Staurois parvus]
MISATHQFHPPVPTNAVLPVSATYQCCLSVPISATSLVLPIS